MQAQAYSLGIVYRDMTELKLDPANARQHKPRQISLLAKSIESFGFNVPILIDEQGTIIAGHARLMAGQKLGLTSFPTIQLSHLTPDQLRAFNIADNRLAEISTWDDKLLGEQLKALSIVDLNFDLEATGFTMGEIDLRIEGLDQPLPIDAMDEALPIEGPAVTKPGDLWVLGEHRIYCGSALEPESYQRLLEKRQANLIFSDPPFNVKIDGHVGGKGAIKHREFAMASGEMSSEEFIAFLHTVFRLLAQHSKAGSIHFHCMDWRHLPEILAAGNTAYTELKNLCVWVKHQAGMGSFYRSQHELVLVYLSGEGAYQNNIQLGRFGRHRSNIWQYPGIHGMRNGEEGDLLALHPTVKPIRMVADAILDCSSRGDVVLDPFLGSGTTLLAAERVGRKCSAIELDPRYVDVSIRRWQNLTGRDAMLLDRQETFTQLEQRAESHHD